tara:strand:- start:135 stop:899 length:765 start_codon:yes stop_codon:yes gene_type:complete
MNYQEERMKDLVGNLPQNRNVDWDNVVPVIDFQFSDHPDPVKARRKNIKRAMKTLKPVKRFTGLFGYKYNSKPFQCVVSGVDCRNMDYGDLFDQYFRDPQTLQPTVFRPWTGVAPGKGRRMQGTYCPQAMQLYHLLIEWMEQEESEHERGFFKQMKKKGVSFIPIKKSPKPEEHPLIVKWTPAFIEAQKDGIPIQHYRNPVTGENDITILIFDNRMLANTMPTDTILRNNMSMAQYHQLVEQAAKLEQEPSSQG